MKNLVENAFGDIVERTDYGNHKNQLNLFDNLNDVVEENITTDDILDVDKYKKIGYDNAAKIAKNALKNKTTLKTEAIKTGLINERDYNKIVDPKKMIYPA